jgi:UDP-MurNAc hydroxylase
MLNYNAAGPYPACFANLSETEKKSESERILSRNLDYMKSLLDALKPKFCLPFAGAYVLGGRLASKNPVLGTMSWERCAEGLKSRAVPTEVVLMREGCVLDVESGSVNPEYENLKDEETREYIDRYLSAMVYPYEDDPQPDLASLDADVQVAMGRMHQRALEWGLATSFTVRLRSGAEWTIISQEHSDSANELICELDPRLLRRILDRQANWNSAEIGCHIEFWREPNIYEPDLHTMLQLFHL